MAESGPRATAKATAYIGESGRHEGGTVVKRVNEDQFHS